MNKYIMALDQGTTSSRCIIFNNKGEEISRAQKEFKQIFPNPGWVEHNPMEIWESQLEVAKKALKKANLKGNDITAIGIANQRETTVVWDKNTGKPIYNAIVWQCRRTSKFCKKLENKGYEGLIKEKTGLHIDPYFSGTKIRWILDNVDGAKEKAKEGNLLFGTIETWIIWNLTKGRIHVTDYTNASRTMLFNIERLTWDDEILSILNINKKMLPKPVSNSEVYGYTDSKFFGEAIPIASAIGDQQAALFGQGCLTNGEGKMTYGTGGFMLLNTGETPFISNHGLLTTIAYGIDNKVCYALEGSIFVAGAAIQWLRDELGLIKKSTETEAMALKAGCNQGVYVVPAFTGLGAPYWDPYARGTICGITRDTSKEVIVRAVLESLAYQTNDISKAMEEDFLGSMETFKVDGGACSNNFLMQFQADILNKEVIRPSNIEATALGAALLAGLATNCWENIEGVRDTIETERVFIPQMDSKTRKNLLTSWKKAVDRSLNWV